MEGEGEEVVIVAGYLSEAGCPFAYTFRATWTRDGGRAMMIFSRWIEIEDATGREGCRRWDWHLLPSTSLLPFRTSVLPKLPNLLSNVVADFSSIPVLPRKSRAR